MTTQPATGVGERLLHAIVERDFPAIAACFSEDTRFRALVPRGLREATGPWDTAGYFQTWFGSATRIEVLTSRCEAIGDRSHLAWRLRVEEPDRLSILEQHVFASLVEDRITQCDLLCSGFRPLESSEGMTVAAFVDGGDEGCATLTPLIKASLGKLASQQVLEIITREPSAASDIASWCTLTGNVLLETRAEGDLQRIYVRKK